MTDVPSRCDLEGTSDENPTTSRALRACLAVCIGYALLVSVGLLLRAEIHRWGFLLSDWQVKPLWLALGCHLSAAVIFGLLLFRLRRRARVPALWARWLLALMPVLLLVSADLVASVEYRPILERTEQMQTHPVRLWEFRPGSVRTHRGVTNKINAHGLWGPLVPYEKKADERRILFLGDSITYGFNVDEEDCFVWQVRDLANEGSGGRPISVVNCSVTGYSPWQEYDLLKTKGLRYDPDLIVQVFCINDLGEKFNLVNFGGRTLHLAPPEPATFEWSGLYRMSRALAFQWFGPSRAELDARERAYSNDAIFDQSDAPHIREAMRITRETMNRIASLARERGIPLVVVGFPMARQIDLAAPDSSPPREWLAAFSREEKVPLLDLVPVYRAYVRDNGISALDLFPDKIHPNKLANRIAAKAIYEFLLEGGWFE
ncbi:MAG: SGNH/GDSL hydrolase family protein [Planctomycetes bacterium]|nr:SGNH/GDSL hydrolase family protein [Planctomycetota bacterium]